MCNEVNETILQYVGITEREVIVRYAVESDSYGTVFIPGFMKIGSGIKVILMLLPQQFEKPQCPYYQ
jgi:hypothetical protein